MTKLYLLFVFVFLPFNLIKGDDNKTPEEPLMLFL